MQVERPERPDLGPTDRRSPRIDPRCKGKPRSRQKDTVVIIDHLAPDAYGLLILAPEIALGSGWLGGDRVVGRAAIRDLLKKAARFNLEERQRLIIHLPSGALTLRLDEVERYCGP
jgi:predicted metalloprotease